MSIKISFSCHTGLPNELRVFWQQYPWELPVIVCKARAFVSEMWVNIYHSNFIYFYDITLPNFFSAIVTTKENIFNYDLNKEKRLTNLIFFIHLFNTYETNPIVKKEREGGAP